MDHSSLPAPTQSAAMHHRYDWPRRYNSPSAIAGEASNASSSVLVASTSEAVLQSAHFDFTVTVDQVHSPSRRDRRGVHVRDRFEPLRPEDALALVDIVHREDAAVQLRVDQVRTGEQRRRNVGRVGRATPEHAVRALELAARARQLDRDQRASPGSHW